MVWKIVMVECFDDWFLGLDASEQRVGRHIGSRTIRPDDLGQTAR